MGFLFFFTSRWVQVFLVGVWVQVCVGNASLDGVFASGFTYLFCCWSLMLAALLNELLLVRHELLGVFVAENAWSAANVLGLGVAANLPEPRVPVDQADLLVCLDLVQELVPSTLFECLHVANHVKVNVGDEERVSSLAVFALNHVHVMDTVLAEDLIEHLCNTVAIHAGVNAGNADRRNVDGRSHVVRKFVSGCRLLIAVECWGVCSTLHLLRNQVQFFFVVLRTCIFFREPYLPNIYHNVVSEITKKKMFVGFLFFLMFIWFYWFFVFFVFFSHVTDCVYSSSSSMNLTFPFSLS